MKLKIFILTDEKSWIYPYLKVLVKKLLLKGHSAKIIHERGEERSNLSFFLSYSKIASKKSLAFSDNNIVIHGSDLPKGRGWSPWSWQILAGQNSLCLSLFEATNSVDAGPIYYQKWIKLEGHELIREWQAIQAKNIETMCLNFIEKYPKSLKSAFNQVGDATYYEARNPSDSKLNIYDSIESQINLMRIVDNNRYPAYFEYDGCEYSLKIEKRKKVNR